MKTQQSLKMLIIFSIALSISISGCSRKLIMVPTACEIPNVSEPMIDTSDKNTTLGEAKKCAMNYFQVKQAYESLKKAVGVCR